MHPHAPRIARVVPAVVLVLAACESHSSIGPNASLIEAGSFANATSCTATLGAESVEKVYVPRNATCTLDGTRVEGDVKVARGGTLIANSADIEGNVQAEDAAAVSLLAGTFVGGDVQVKRRALVTVTDTRIDGDLQLEESGTSLVADDVVIGGNLQMKKAASADITLVRVDGDLQLEENTAALAATGSDIRGNLQVFKNRGGVTLQDNQVAQALQCKENSPAPTGGGNVAGEKEEQCSAL